MDLSRHSGLNNGGMLRKPKKTDCCAVEPKTEISSPSYIPITLLQRESDLWIGTKISSSPLPMTIPGNNGLVSLPTNPLIPMPCFLALAEFETPTAWFTAVTALSARLPTGAGTSLRVSCLSKLVYVFECVLSGRKITYSLSDRSSKNRRGED
jgi:hypothetical protein